VASSSGVVIPRSSSYDRPEAGPQGNRQRKPIVLTVRVRDGGIGLPSRQLADNRGSNSVYTTRAFVRSCLSSALAALCPDLSIAATSTFQRGWAGVAEPGCGNAAVFRSTVAGGEQLYYPSGDLLNELARPNHCRTSPAASVQRLPVRPPRESDHRLGSIDPSGCRTFIFTRLRRDRAGRGCALHQTSCIPCRRLLVSQFQQTIHAPFRAEAVSRNTVGNPGKRRSVSLSVRPQAGARRLNFRGRRTGPLRRLPSAQADEPSTHATTTLER